MQTTLKATLVAAVIGLAAGSVLAAEPPTTAEKAIPPLLQELSKYQDAETTVNKNLGTFDTLDFDVYTHQKWDRLHESHAPDILVHYPDGHTTKGLDAHIAELKPMFVFRRIRGSSNIR